MSRSQRLGFLAVAAVMAVVAVDVFEFWRLVFDSEADLSDTS